MTARCACAAGPATSVVTKPNNHGDHDMTLQQHLGSARAHLLAAAADVEQYIKDTGETATPIIASAFGIDFSTLQGAEHLLMCLAVDTAIDHIDQVKVAVMRGKHYRKPSESPSARARREVREA